MIDPLKVTRHRVARVAFPFIWRLNLDGDRAGPLLLLDFSYRSMEHCTKSHPAPAAATLMHNYDSGSEFTHIP